MPTEDGRWRLQSAWAATVDPRYSTLASSDPTKPGSTRPKWNTSRESLGAIEATGWPA
jgi:hypothetical protein